MSFHFPYKSPPNYRILAKDVPEFAQFVQTTAEEQPTIDFQNPEAVRSLNCALLKRDFGLDVIMPPNRLCPVVPGRLEYIHWILQVALYPNDKNTTLSGIDIGTGPTAIYPLLGCSTLTKLKMVATEIDEESYQVARKNVAACAKQIGGNIALVKVDASDGILYKAVELGGVKFDFTMCNPPFYSSLEEISVLASGKQSEPFATCTGAVNEMITPGGEVAFVSRMIEESLHLADKIRWFSSLLGKFSSLATLVQKLQTLKITNYAIHVSNVGHTKRWVLAWSFEGLRLPDRLTQPTPPLPSNPNLPPKPTTHAENAFTKLLLPPNTFLYHLKEATEMEIDEESQLARVAVLIRGILGELGFKLVESRNATNWIAEATQNTWSRAARRKKLRDMRDQMESKDASVPFFGFALSVSCEKEGVVLKAEWTFGQEREVFLSFWRHFTRRLSS